jgi:hypothetical protein
LILTIEGHDLLGFAVGIDDPARSEGGELPLFEKTPETENSEPEPIERKCACGEVFTGELKTFLDHIRNCGKLTGYLSEKERQVQSELHVGTGPVATGPRLVRPGKPAAREGAG